VSELVTLLVDTFAELMSFQVGDFTLLRVNEAVLLTAGIVGVTASVLLYRVLRGRAGRVSITLPALLSRQLVPPRYLRPFRHAAFVLFVIGFGFLVVGIADPHTALVEEVETYPGHRITMMIDASLSMNTAFATEQLSAGNTFLANVSAAEYFVKRRMEGPYQDLVSLVQFGNEAYIVTPFTNDYENILLSISLIGTPEEYRRFPDHGTLIMQAVSRGVQLFRTFDFLGATGNLMVIFSDGQDTYARFEDVTLDAIMQEAADNGIPVYFIRTAYNQTLGEVISDQQWKLAVERTGGKFFPAENETAILSAIHEIDELAKGRLRVKRYVAHEPQFQPFVLAAVACWLLALVMTLSVRRLRRFP
jgi:hypothetical protein